MNRQRKVVITVTYNELGAIVDTKAEELDSSAQPNLQPTCNQLATDTISRQAAIDCVTYDVEHTIECLKALSSAQPERKKGQWLRYGEDGYPNNEDTVFWQCDQCLDQYTGRAKKIPNFCPNCGADMRKENES